MEGGVCVCVGGGISKSNRMISIRLLFRYLGIMGVNGSMAGGDLGY